MSQINSYIAQHKDRFIEELIELLKLPSVSADSAFSQDVLDTAEAFASALREAGCDTVEICDTQGYPIIFGEKKVDPSLPTVLVYGHYDVQPPDPLDLWNSPPFEPEIRQNDLHPDGAIFARGASDDKGQVFMHIKALEFMVRHDALPCNIKFMIEGEEEVGSVSLSDFVKEHREKLSNDIILISDTGLIAKDVPSVTTGLRGLSYVEVTVTGANRDLHSG
ncbi:MAG: M20/M25/M40 family metallo-hydrolase, partial [Robiginitalea sp.]